MILVVVGAQWGDEGKGKMVDYLSEGADIVVRFSGGANAGHTVRIDDRTFALHLVPAGIISPGKTVVLGNDMVVDPFALFEELGDIESQGVQWQGRVLVSDRTHLVLPDYKDADKRDDELRARPIGTTGRGIGVAYHHKASRDGIRVADLWDPVIWDSLNESRRDMLQPYKDRLASMKVNLTYFMMAAVRDGKNILLEGAQGTLLDLDHGTYPYVSSGASTSSGAARGSALGPRHIDKCLAVFKAYQTRVGNGPFPTEMTREHEELGRKLRELGHEYGVTTGRPRRIGFLDLVALRYAGWINSLDGFILSHLNLYDGFETIGICTAYMIDGERIDVFPSCAAELERVEPVIEYFPGWKGRVADARSFDQLPAGAQDFIAMIEKASGVPVHGYSVGPLRDQTFLTSDPWKA